MTNVVDARGLQISAGAHVLVRDLGLTIGAGERVALVGHNGAGKSTVLRALAGFARVSRGSLRVLDTDLSLSRRGVALRRLRGRLAHVHQGLHLIGRLSAIDNVLIGGAGRCTNASTWLRRWPDAERRAAHAALARVGMAACATRRTDSLSGGERQKVAIARALHQNAPVLLADEPTASLDAQASDEVVGLLAAVALERRSTLLCVVHDLDLLPRLAERVVVLRRGSVIADMRVTAQTPAELRSLLR